MTSYNGEFFGCTAQRHFEQLLEWAEQAFQSYTLEYENAESQYQKVITERRNRNYTAGDYCDWSEYGTKTRDSLDMYRHRISDRCFASKAHLDKAKKELDDYMASKAVPCAEATDAPDELQDADAPVTTCCPGGVQNTNDSNSSDDEDDDE